MSAVRGADTGSDLHSWAVSRAPLVLATVDRYGIFTSAQGNATTWGEVDGEVDIDLELDMGSTDPALPGYPGSDQ